MKRILSVAIVWSCILISTAGAHDLFLKLDTYISSPDAKATVRLFNGTFQQSEGRVLQDRLENISMVAPDGKVISPELNSWRHEGQTTLFDVQPITTGTYIIAVSTKHREITLKAADFNGYLEHDGIPDILADRKQKGELNKDAHERYSKHVKAIFQVGDKITESYKKPLNYPVEIIPQQNPYALKPGQTLEVLCLLEGKPIANQFVMFGSEPWGGSSSSFTTRADAQGIARIELKRSGKWFVKFIHMSSLGDPKLNYESKWASLTFEIK